MSPFTPADPLEDRDDDVQPVIKIRPTKGPLALDLRELWQYRELLYFFTWRDVKVRYKQTLLGASWAIIQPLSTMVVFTIFFGELAKIPSDGIPYPIFSFCGLLPWTLFSGALTRASGSLVSGASLITKVYFPRLIVPIAAVLAGLVDFAISFLVLLAMMLYFGYMPTAKVLFLPVFLLLAIGTGLAIGLWLSALNVHYRDVAYTVPFLTQVWLFASPVAYSSSLLSEKWRLLYALNPMVGVIEGFRWALLGRELAVSGMTAVSAVIVAALFAGGLYYFRKMERTFADIV